jgi:hypothetical protein
MDWSEHTQRRFDDLRQRERIGPLSAEDQRERAALLAILDADEARTLAPTLARMDREAAQREAQRTALQVRNEELAALAGPHAQLLREATSWLTSFAQRRLVLQDRYTRLAAEPLPTDLRP